jgi:hypothetical protein
MPTPNQAPDVYVIGAMNRSGTTYLADCLAATGDFQRSAWGFEDYLHFNSSYLLEYTQRTLAQWRANRPDLPDRALLLAARDLAHSLGAALDRAHRVANGGDGVDGAQTRFVLKTPSPVGIESFFSLHQRSLLVIVIRDGRDAVESARRSWSSWSIESGAQTWAANVRTIVQFVAALSPAERKRCLMVRYEDVARGHKRAFAKVFRFAGVPLERVPWQTIRQLPLRGSSTERGDSGALNWNPIPKPRAFNPIGRWRGWTRSEKQSFKRNAGRELIELGYAEHSRW